MIFVLLALCILVSAQNSTISTQDLLDDIPPFGNIVTLIPFSAVSDSRIFVDIVNPPSSEVYGSGFRDVRQGSGDTRVTVSVRGIITPALGYQLRVYIISQADINDPDPVSKAIDLQASPVAITNASDFEAYAIQVQFNFTPSCEVLENPLVEAFESNLPPVDSTVSLVVRSIACSDFNTNSQAKISFSIAGGNMTDRLTNLFATYAKLTDTYFQSIALNISTDLTVNNVFVTGYDFDTNAELFVFWQVFGTMLALIGGFGVWAIVLNIYYAIIFGSDSKHEHV